MMKSLYGRKWEEHCRFGDHFAGLRLRSGALMAEVKPGKCDQDFWSQIGAASPPPSMLLDPLFGPPIPGTLSKIIYTNTFEK